MNNVTGGHTIEDIYKQLEVLKELPRDDWRLKRTIEKAVRKIEGR